MFTEQSIEAYQVCKNVLLIHIIDDGEMLYRYPDVG